MGCPIRLNLASNCPQIRELDVVRCDDLRNDEACLAEHERLLPLIVTCERGGPHHEPRRVERSPDRECELSLLEEQYGATKWA